jgi:protein-tyrosine-phosphatase
MIFEDGGSNGHERAWFLDRQSNEEESDVGKIVVFLLLVVVTAMNGRCAIAAKRNVNLDATIRDYVEARIEEFVQIPRERQEQLGDLTRYVESCRTNGQPAKLTFICTHNSRRSQMSQLWAAAAAAYYGVDSVETFSGGTESTQFNPRAIAALERAGFEFEGDGQVSTSRNSDLVSNTVTAKNTRHKVSFARDKKPLVCFSKRYDSDANPHADFCAVMTCSDAEENCPIVRGAAKQIGITYDDPKIADGTPEETAAYDERCAQIAREMLFVFSHVK